MKLGTLKDGSRDGALCVVSRNLKLARIASDVAPTLQAALDDWGYCAPLLQALSDELNHPSASLGASAGSRLFEPDFSQFAAPLPRAYQWLDASAYLAHVELVRKARGAEMPSEMRKDPLMYQGNSDYFIGPQDDIRCESEDWGIDLEAEVAVILDDTLMGLERDKATHQILLLTLVNDVSLRNLIPEELAKGFGFVQGKAATAFTPLAVTPDELGPVWDGRKLSLPMRVSVNDQVLGSPHCGSDMQFDFPRLIVHAAKTRPLPAGTVLGSGTISNYGHDSGHACIAELRAMETVRDGAAATPFLKFGDRVRIEMLDSQGQSIFGAIDQQVVSARSPRRERPIADVLARPAAIPPASIQPVPADQSDQTEPDQADQQSASN